MPETKTCPYCGEEILTAARKCKHCGEWFDATEKIPTIDKKDLTTLVKELLSSKYDIIEVVGKGGMATVYKGVQKSLNRIVAIKVVHQNLIHDEEFLRRFHREAQLAASLTHNNIVHVYDEGQINNLHFIVMEYLDGKDLHTMIKESGKIEVIKTLNIITPIAGTLMYAHNKGIIHRDIKSSNIFVTKEGKAVLTDFGIAHANSGTKLTQTGTVIGTPEYMSPEQAEGKIIDERSDLYSLGVVMFESLTANLPFKGENPISTIYRIINEKPKGVREIVGEIPKEVEEIIEKLLSKKKEDRFKNGDELVEKLKHTLTDLHQQPSKAKSLSKDFGTGERKIITPDRKDPILNKNDKERIVTPPKVLVPPSLKKTESAISPQSADKAKNLSSQQPPLRQEKTKEPTLGTLNKTKNGEPFDRNRLEPKLVQAKKGKNKIAKMILAGLFFFLVISFVVWRIFLVGKNQKDSLAYYNEGITFYNKGDIGNAIDAFNESLSANSVDPKFINLSGEYLGKIYFQQGHYDESINSYQKVISVLEKNSDKTSNKNKLSEIYIQVSNAYKKNGDSSKEAESYWKSWRYGNSKAEAWLRANDYSWNKDSYQKNAAIQQPIINPDVSVPNLIGNPYIAATGKLDALNLKYRINKELSSEANLGKVIKQSISSNRKVAKGTLIILTVGD